MNLNPYNKSYILTPRSMRQLLEVVIHTGNVCYPNGEKTYELINPTLILRDPIDRIFSDPARKFNIGFANAEWIGMMMGVNELTFYDAFISTYGNYSSDGMTVDGAYGNRINFFSSRLMIDMNQVEGIIETLKADMNSRRAVISIYDREDLFGAGGKNTPCTLTIQFLMRDKLHMIVNMRSSDAFLGLTYDMYQFTMLQEYIARNLGVELGYYFHNAGSLHVYHDHIRKFNFKALGLRRWSFIMNPMPPVSKDDLGLFLVSMWEVIDKNKTAINELVTTSKYWSSTAAFEYFSNLTRASAAQIFRSVDPIYAKGMHADISDKTIRHVAKLWLKG